MYNVLNEIIIALGHAASRWFTHQNNIKTDIQTPEPNSKSKMANPATSPPPNLPLTTDIQQKGQQTFQRKS